MNLKIRLEYKDGVFEYERQPMKEGRFRALCALALTVIVGGVFLGTVAMCGIWAIAWAVGSLVAVGFYRLAKEGFR